MLFCIYCHLCMCFCNSPNRRKYKNLFIYTQKSVCATSTIPFGEVGGDSPLQLSSRTHFAKIEDKKVIAKN